MMLNSSKPLAERYNALTLQLQHVAGVLFLACTEARAKRSSELCWEEAIRQAEEMMRL